MDSSQTPEKQGFSCGSRSEFRRVVRIVADKIIPFDDRVRQDEYVRWAPYNAD